MDRDIAIWLYSSIFTDLVAFLYFVCNSIWISYTFMITVCCHSFLEWFDFLMIFQFLLSFIYVWIYNCWFIFCYLKFYTLYHFSSLRSSLFVVRQTGLGPSSVNGFFWVRDNFLIWCECISLLYTLSKIDS